MPNSCGRREEDAVLEHPLGLEVGPQRGQVDVVGRLADALGVEGPVPGLDRVPGLALERLLLGARVGGRHGRHALHQVAHRPGRAGGVVDGRGRGVAVEAEEGGALGAQAHHLQQGLAGVVRVAPAAPGALGLARAGAASPGWSARPGADGPWAAARVITCLPSSPRSSATAAAAEISPAAEPVELGHVVHDQRQLVGVGEQRLLELGLQRGELPVELLQLSACRRRRARLPPG